MFVGLVAGSQKHTVEADGVRCARLPDMTRGETSLQKSHRLIPLSEHIPQRNVHGVWDARGM